MNVRDLFRRFLKFRPAACSRTFSELHGIDHATTIRAIADIWFPRQQQLPLERGAAFSSITANVESSPRDKMQNRVLADQTSPVAP
ncbi:MAG: hypothetical protein DMF00_15315 [Verrucomicrobia bacterium]|nr:MAG: hypothetical protein DMF00_15315 [Verrucomicrobiota bacterium]